MTKLEKLPQHLAETEIFKALQPQFHEAIAGKCEVRTYKKDQKVVSQGEQGNEFFLILSGTVAVLLEDFALWSEQRILELREGQSFGESALLNDTRRTATVKTLEETTCAVLNRSNFEKLMSRVPEVGMAISKYLAQRLAVQCQLTGYRFVSGDELVFNPKIYRAFPSAVLTKWKAVPLTLRGRTITVALTRPNDPEAVKALQKEVPGFGLELVACTEEDYRAFRHRYLPENARGTAAVGTEELEILKMDGTRIQPPLRAVLEAMQRSNEERIIMEIDSSSSQILAHRSGDLQPFLPPLVKDESKNLKRQLDSLVGASESPATRETLTVKIEERPCQLSFSVLRGPHRCRYSLERTDVASAVPPLAALFPSTSIANVVRGALNEEGRTVFVYGTKGSGVSTTLYSLLESREEPLRRRNLLLFEERPLVPQDDIIQFPLGKNLDSLLSVAALQRPEIIAFDSLSSEQLDELIHHPDVRATVVATYRGDNLLDILAGSAARSKGRAPALHRVSLLLQQQLVRRICAHCCCSYEPSAEQLQELRQSKLDNPDSRYFRGEGCEECDQTGVLGQVALFEGLHCTRALLESLAGLHRNSHTKLQALQDSLAFSFRGFARLLLSQGMMDPLEALRMFPAGPVHSSPL